MAERDLSYQDLLQILQLVEESTQFTDFHLKFGDIELDLRKHGSQQGPMSSPQPPVAAPSSTEHAGAPAPTSAPVATSTTVSAVEKPGFLSDGSTVIKSPMVGTFYRASEPGGEPFVSVGQRVEADTIVCILEVMKLMNSIPAGTAGVVTQILVKDGEAVEFGQPLIIIDPTA